MLDELSEPDAPAFVPSPVTSFDHLDVDDDVVCVSFVVTRRGALEVEDGLLAVERQNIHDRSGHVLCHIYSNNQHKVRPMDPEKERERIRTGRWCRLCWCGGG